MSATVYYGSKLCQLFLALFPRCLQQFFLLRKVIVWTIISCLPLVMKRNLKFVGKCSLESGML